MQSSLATGKPASPSGSCGSKLTARIGHVARPPTWNDREAWENALGTAVPRGEVKFDDKSLATADLGDRRSCHRPAWWLPARVRRLGWDDALAQCVYYAHGEGEHYAP